MAKIVPEYDFTEALALPLTARLKQTLAKAHVNCAADAFFPEPGFDFFPRIGASKVELQEFESSVGVKLPKEYRRFLSLCRFLKTSDDCEVFGLGQEAGNPIEKPRLWTDNREGASYLSFARFTLYGDGGELAFDMSDADTPVVAYLPKRRRKFHPYAPSFSLAFWRLMHEGPMGMKGYADLVISVFTKPIARFGFDFHSQSVQDEYFEIRFAKRDRYVTIEASSHFRDPPYFNVSVGEGDPSRDRGQISVLQVKKQFCKWSEMTGFLFGTPATRPQMLKNAVDDLLKYCAPFMSGDRNFFHSLRSVD